MRYVPYLIGAFMLLPFVLWAGLYLAFPGPKPGITDAPVAVSLVALSLPLVLFHYIAGLGYVANSIAGQAGEVLPIWTPARWVQRAMAPLTFLLSALAFGFLVSQGQSWMTATGVAFAGGLAGRPVHGLGASGAARAGAGMDAARSRSQSPTRHAFADAQSSFVDERFGGGVWFHRAGDPGHDRHSVRVLRHAGAGV